MKLSVTDEFKNLFLVVIQLGAIMAVVILFWNKLWPFAITTNRKITVQKDKIILWVKIVLACIPAAIVGILFDSLFEKLFYHAVNVALALIIFGIALLVIERRNQGSTPKVTSMNDLSYSIVFWIDMNFWPIFKQSVKGGGNLMQFIKSLDQYPPIDHIFSLIYKKTDTVFLDSSLQNHLGRYSIIGLKPYLKLVNGKTFTVNGKISKIPFEVYVKDYLRKHQEINHTNLPLTSGAIGYFSYDYGRKKENVKAHCPVDVEIPDCILIFYDSFIIEDHKEKKLWLVTNDHEQDAEEGMKELLNLVQMAKESIESKSSQNKKSKVTANFTKQEYMDAVSRVIDYITEGDVYIANLTQQLKIQSNISPYEMFRKLRKDNPSPFGAYLNYGEFQVVSSSPERFLQMKKGKVETRPIKGTRKRGVTLKEDLLMKKELEESAKDQSELLMIVDLERNDLNRVCIPGSVKVTQLFEVETYATVFHLIANIEGMIRPDMTVMDLLEATFPGGSITGAPKLRAMEIIDELEHSRRNIYTGSLGYLSLDGDCDFNIIIRTALCKDQTFYLGVGGGITCESDPLFEYEETLQKAKALVESLGEKIEEC